jgi:hypothetical protein
MSIKSSVKYDNDARVALVFVVSIVLFGLIALVNTSQQISHPAAATVSNDDLKARVAQHGGFQ